MKNLPIMLLVILISSCTTVEVTPSSEERMLIWIVNELKQSDVNYTKDYFKEVYITQNLETKKTHITYRFNAESVYQFEKNWRFEVENIRLDNLYIVQELKFKRKENRIRLTSVIYDVVLEGENIGEIRKSINRQVYTERAGESDGVIQLIMRKWNPSILDTIPIPLLKRGDDLFVESLGDDNFKIYGANAMFMMENKGEHLWLGY